MKRLGIFIRGLVGYLVDLCRIVRFQFSNPHSYTKFRIINAVRRRTGSETFVESGTNLGRTADRCAGVFKQVITIELDNVLADRAAKFLGSRANVEVIRGDAVTELPQILSRPDLKGALVFLDGHFSGGDTACGELPEPAIEEIAILGRFVGKIRAVIIDDFRCFGTEMGFPMKSNLLRQIEICFPVEEFETRIEMDQAIILRRR